MSESPGHEKQTPVVRPLEPVVERLVRLGVDPRQIESGLTPLPLGTWEQLEPLIRLVRGTQARFGFAVWLYQMCARSLQDGLQLEALSAILENWSIWRVMAHLPKTREQILELSMPCWWIAPVGCEITRRAFWSSACDREGEKICGLIRTQLEQGGDAQEVAKQLLGPVPPTSTTPRLRLPVTIRNVITRGSRYVLVLFLIIACWQGFVHWFFWQQQPNFTKYDLIGEFDAEVGSLPKNSKAWPYYRPLLVTIVESARKEAWLHPMQLDELSKTTTQHADWTAVTEFLKEHQQEIQSVLIGSQRDTLGYSYRDPANQPWESIYRPDYFSQYPYPPTTELYFMSATHLHDLPYMLGILELQSIVARIDGDMDLAFRAYIARLRIAAQLVAAPDYQAHRTLDVLLVGKVLRSAHRSYSQFSGKLSRQQRHELERTLLELGQSNICRTNGRWKWTRAVLAQWYSAGNSDDSRILGSSMKRIHDSLPYTRWFSESGGTGSYNMMSYQKSSLETTLRAPYLSQSMATLTELDLNISALVTDDELRFSGENWGATSLRSLPTLATLMNTPESAFRHYPLQILALSAGDFPQQTMEFIRQVLCVEGLRIGVALDDFMDEHKRYPTSLKELEDAGFGAILTDPFNGALPNYFVDADGPVVYYNGPDGTDDTEASRRMADPETKPARVDKHDVMVYPGFQE